MGRVVRRRLKGALVRRGESIRQSWISLRAGDDLSSGREPGELRIGPELANVHELRCARRCAPLIDQRTRVIVVLLHSWVGLGALTGSNLGLELVWKLEERDVHVGGARV